MGFILGFLTAAVGIYWLCSSTNSKAIAFRLWASRLWDPK